MLFVVLQMLLLVTRDTSGYTTLKRCVLPRGFAQDTRVLRRNQNGDGDRKLIRTGRRRRSNAIKAETVIRPELDSASWNQCFGDEALLLLP